MDAAEPLKHVAGQKHDNHTKDLKSETKCDCGYFSDSTEELCHQGDRKEVMIESNNEEKVVIESGDGMEVVIESGDGKEVVIESINGDEEVDAGEVGTSKVAFRCLIWTLV